MKKMFGAEIALVKSGGGAFEVSADGKTVFSKLSQGRFPDDGEIAGLIRDL